jgi:periplasmic protein TonB
VTAAAGPAALRATGGRIAGAASSGPPLALRLAAGLSLLLHAAALGAVFLLLRREAPAEPRPQTGLAFVWEEMPAEAQAAAPAPPPAAPPPGAAPAAPPPPAPPPSPPGADAAPPVPPPPPGEEAALPAPPPPASGAAAAPPGPPAAPPSAPPAAAPAPAAPPAEPRPAPPGPEAPAAAPPGGSRALGPLVPPGVLPGIRNAEPDYPALSRQLGHQGAVRLILHVDSTGEVVSVEVAQSSGHPELDESARRAALGWRFQPARRDGIAVPSTVGNTVHFRLGG